MTRREIERDNRNLLNQLPKKSKNKLVDTLISISTLTPQEAQQQSQRLRKMERLWTKTHEVLGEITMINLRLSGMMGRNRERNPVIIRALRKSLKTKKTRLNKLVEQYIKEGLILIAE